MKNKTPEKVGAMHNKVCLKPKREKNVFGPVGFSTSEEGALLQEYWDGLFAFTSQKWQARAALQN